MGSLLGVIRRGLGFNGDRVAELRAAGDAARVAGAWSDALAYYDRAAVLRPGAHALQIRRGHALKELGRLDEAEAAYRNALSGQPRSREYHLHLGHVLKLKQSMGAALLAYQEALRLGDERAKVEILSLAGRAALEGAGDRSALHSVIGNIGDEVTRLNENLDAALRQSAFSPIAYAQMRGRLVSDPPKILIPEGVALDVVVDGRGRSPAEILLTLYSLQDQSWRAWSALVLADEQVSDHPVGSLAHQDMRIHFNSSLDDEVARGAGVVTVEAGVRLEPSCLAWLLFTLFQTGAAAVYGDHDHAVHDWRGVTSYSEPTLYGAYDEIGLMRGGEPPLVLLVSTECGVAVAKELKRSISTRHLHKTLLLDMKGSLVSHVPRLLATLCGVNQPPQMWMSSLDAEGDELLPWAGEERILVVVPTRDAPDLLRAAVESLIEKSERPELLRILVVDNRSSEESSRALFKALAGRGVDILSVDEPFNWARLNNLAVVEADEEILVFANNDIEAIIAGWDDMVRRAVASAGGGCVGTKLLYADGRIQHAGVLLGGRNGGPVHEGLDRPATDPGPGGRWAQVRRCAAVTGAFMAVSRAVFHEVGQFNERLAIGYSDLDFCLRCRRSNHAVVYDPSFVMIHHESKTRGTNSSIDEISWDEIEMRMFFDLWGSAAMSDPGRNPQWVTENRNAFDGLKNLSDRELDNYFVAKNVRLPWKIN